MRTIEIREIAHTVQTAEGRAPGSIIRTTGGRDLGTIWRTFRTEGARLVSEWQWRAASGQESGAARDAAAAIEALVQSTAGASVSHALPVLPFPDRDRAPRVAAGPVRVTYAPEPAAPPKAPVKFDTKDMAAQIRAAFDKR